MKDEKVVHLGAVKADVELQRLLASEPHVAVELFFWRRPNGHFAATWRTNSRIGNPNPAQWKEIAGVVASYGVELYDYACGEGPRSRVKVRRAIRRRKTGRR